MSNSNFDPIALAEITNKIVSLYSPDEQLAKAKEFNSISAMNQNSPIFWHQLRGFVSELCEVALDKGLGNDTIKQKEVFFIRQVLFYVEGREKEIKNSLFKAILERCDQLN